MKATLFVCKRGFRWLFDQALGNLLYRSVRLAEGPHRGVGMPVPFDQIPVGEGLLPDGNRVPFFVDRRTLDLLAEYGLAEKYDDARFVPVAVSRPDAIFKGLRRPNQHEGLCYSVRPESDPDADKENDAQFAGLPRYGVAFLAFVLVGNMGYVVFDWEWREEDPDQPGHPLGWRTDFAAKVYP